MNGKRRKGEAMEDKNKDMGKEIASERALEEKEREDFFRLKKVKKKIRRVE